mgnify:CR=1 FL=1
MSKYSQPLFLGSAPTAREAAVLRAKAADYPIVAFCGRSNVGKSSLLNSLCGETIARVSQEPGRTQSINFFRWRGCLLADLPGYGYAKVAKTTRDACGREVPKFLEAGVALVVALVDGRQGITDKDRAFLCFLQDRGIQHIVVFTKMDKMKSANQERSAQAKLSRELSALGGPDPLFASAKDGRGLGPILSIFEELGRT